MSMTQPVRRGHLGGVAAGPPQQVADQHRAPTSAHDDHVGPVDHREGRHQDVAGQGAGRR